MLPEPRNNSQQLGPDWLLCWEAYQDGRFECTQEEAWIIEAHLHGYRGTQIASWCRSTHQYNALVKRLHQRSRGLEAVTRDQLYLPTRPQALEHPNDPR